MSITVGQLKQTNPHVMNLPDFFLKEEEVIVSNLEQNVHAIAQGTLYAGIPASTIPALVKNPHQYGIGAGIGAAVGCIVRLTSTVPNTTLQNLTDWLVHSAAMNTMSKAAIGTTQTAGIAGNAVLASIESSQYASLFEGGLAGAILAYEATGVALGLFIPSPPAPAQNNPAPNPPAPPASSSPAAVRRMEEV